MLMEQYKNLIISLQKRYEYQITLCLNTIYETYIIHIK